MSKNVRTKNDFDELFGVMEHHRIEEVKEALEEFDKSKFNLQGLADTKVGE